MIYTYAYYNPTSGSLTSYRKARVNNKVKL